MNYYVLLLFSFSLSVSSYGMDNIQKGKEDQLNNFFNINGVAKAVNSYSDFLFKCARAPYLSTLHLILGSTIKKENMFSGTKALFPVVLGNSECDGSVQNFIHTSLESFNEFPFEKLQFLKKIRMGLRFDIVMEMFRLLPHSSEISSFFDIFIRLQQKHLFSLQQQQREVFFTFFTIVPRELWDGEKNNFYKSGPTGCRFFTTEKRGEVYFSNVVHCYCGQQQHKDGCLVVGKYVRSSSEEDNRSCFFWTKQSEKTLKNPMSQITIDSVVIQIPLCNGNENGFGDEREKFSVLYDNDIHGENCSALQWIRENMHRSNLLTEKIPNDINDLSLHFLLMKLPTEISIAEKLSQLFDQKKEVTAVLKSVIYNARSYPLKGFFGDGCFERLSCHRIYDLELSFLPKVNNETFGVLLTGDPYITTSSKNVVYFVKKVISDCCPMKAMLSVELLISNKGTWQRRKKASVRKIIYSDSENFEVKPSNCFGCRSNWPRAIEQGVDFLQDIMTILNHNNKENENNTSIDTLVAMFA